MLEVELKNFDDFKKIAHRRDLYVEERENIYIYYVVVRKENMYMVYSFRTKEPLKVQTFFSLNDEEFLLVENIFEIDGIREIKFLDF